MPLSLLLFQAKLYLCNAAGSKQAVQQHDARLPSGHLHLPAEPACMGQPNLKSLGLMHVLPQKYSHLSAS